MQTLRSITRSFVAHLFIAFLLTGLSVACGSVGPEGPEIRAEDPWARPAVAAGAMSAQSGKTGSDMGHAAGGTGAVFLKLMNRGANADRLLGADSDVANVVEIHETRIEGDVMMMQHLPVGLPIPAKGEVILEPGGFHIMLIGLERDLNPDDTFTLRLRFEQSGSQTIEVLVRQP